MMFYTAMNKEQRIAELQQAQQQYAQIKQRGLKLDMSRGKPSKEQLQLSMPMLTMVSTLDDCMVEGTDIRNYGVLDGLPECKRLFADILGVLPSQVLIGGNASLTLMYDVISKAYTHGLLHSDTPWAKLSHAKFLCPTPGYDRHFRITESFGMELITVPMLEDGPDLDVVEALVQDPQVKGMWCVPKYSNPTGCIYSPEVVSRISSLRPASKDFLLMWDNAYCIHEFSGPFVPFPDIISMCEKNGSLLEVYEFCSTSKLTFPGAGVSALASTEENVQYMRKLWSEQSIGYDKINQHRHVLFLQNKEHLLSLMQQHGAIMKTRFDTVIETLDREIAPLDIAVWTRPKGGYFISVDAMEGCATRTIALCKEAGVILTGPGAAFPYGIDPKDRNIRLAPSMPTIEELEQAAEVFCICLRCATLERLIG